MIATSAASDDKHAEARAFYAKFLVRSAELAFLREYANAVITATSGGGMTPVEPLATMGKDGGPLVCDVCGLPMILEGGGYQGMHADEGWSRNPKPGWRSYISGGMVLETEVNGTLRVYHGYPERSGCVRVAGAARAKARAAYRESSRDPAEDLGNIAAYLNDEYPGLATDAYLNQIYRVLFTYDPGLGVNRP